MIIRETIYDFDAEPEWASMMDTVFDHSATMAFRWSMLRPA
jgi:hypothetical protein